MSVTQIMDQDDHRLNINADGSADVTLQTVLSSSQDSVALGGALAQSLATKPNGQVKVSVSNVVIPVTGDASLPITLFDITGSIRLQSLQIVSTGVSPQLKVYTYTSSGTLDPLHMVVKTGLAHMMDVQSYGAVLKDYNHGFMKVTQIDAPTFTYELSLKATTDLPFGLVIIVSNELASTYTVNGEVLYLNIP